MFAKRNKKSKAYYRVDSPVHQPSKARRLLGYSLCFVAVLAALNFMRLYFYATPNGNHTKASTAGIKSAVNGQDASLLAIPNLSSQVTNSQLSSIMETWANKHSSQRWEIYVEDLKNPSRQASFDVSESFELASIYKLFLLQPLIKKLPADKWSSTPLKSDKSVLGCVNAMMAVADNDCATAIGSNVDLASAQSQGRRLGYVSTNLVSKTKMGTAQDTGLLLSNLYNANGFDNHSRQVIMNGMANQKYNWGIPKGCHGCKVYDAVGGANGYLNDAAIIEDNDQVYELVIFSKGGSYAQIADLASKIHAVMMKS